MPTPPQAWVWLAQIRRPQGRKGEVFAEILTDFPERFGQRRKLFLLRAPQPPFSLPKGPPHLGAGKARPSPAQVREVELTNHWLHKGGIVLHFAGVDSISAAEELKGMIVAVPHADRASLADGEAYIGELIGCVLVNVAGGAPVSVGAIEDVDRSAGPVPLLVVRGNAGEVLIPFAKSYMRKIDLEAKRVEMALPEGLVDLNSGS